MLRRLPFTPLVCLAILFTIALAAPAWADPPEESLDVLIKPGKGEPAPAPQTYKAKSRYRVRRVPVAAAVPAPYPTIPTRITKVKPLCPPYAGLCGPRPCILPKTWSKQWEMSGQVFWARVRGTVAWPRWNPFGGNQQNNNEIDLNDVLGVPQHDALGQFSARYQFRPRWSVRYIIFGDELNGGIQGLTNQFNQNRYFGRLNLNTNQNIQSQWHHQYHRLGLVYDPIKTCNMVLSVFGEWVHTDDVLSVSCFQCGNQTARFSVSGNNAIVGVEIQRCVRTNPNGGTYSFHHKFGFIFLDDTEGVDIELGAKYSVPVNCNRWGYVKGGYRYVELKRSEARFLFNHAAEGGFLELGLIF